MLYEKVIRPVIFKLTEDDAEVAHEWAIKWLQKFAAKKTLRKTVKKFCFIESERLDQKIFGLQFPNPVGLAAGFDKNGQAISGLTAWGFGFITAGTVTPFKQEGNKRPRMFRLTEDRALINRMGFNNEGATALALRLSTGEKQSVPIGASIGKMKNTHIENAVDDYLYCLRQLYKFADYFEINISSPNTPELRTLQYKNYLEKLLMALNREMAKLSKKHSGPFKPMLPKISPDLSWGELDDILEACERQRIMGIAAANTTVNRNGLRNKSQESGGLSGEPLYERALEIVRYISKSTNGALPIIGVGGIPTAEYAYEMLKAGASLIQILTSLVYEGPFVVWNINRGLVKIFERDGIGHISEISRKAHAGREIKSCSVMRQRGCQPVLNLERRK